MSFHDKSSHILGNLFQAASLIVTAGGVVGVADGSVALLFEPTLPGLAKTAIAGMVAVAGGYGFIRTCEHFEAPRP